MQRRLPERPVTGIARSHFDPTRADAAAIEAAVARTYRGRGLAARAALEGDARITHRLPPGHKDASKPENKYGDLIIWYEILEHSKRIAVTTEPSASPGSPRVLFVTNDEKPDWVYAPAKRLVEVKGVRKEVGNRDPVIKLPDPRLVAEFHATVGHEEFYISTLPMLIKALSSIRPKNFESLASAIQIEGEDREDTSESEGENEAVSPISDSSILPPEASRIVTNGLAPEVIVTTGEDRNVVDTSPPPSLARFVYPADALRDGAYEADAPGAINEIIRALRSHDWYTQNPAIQKIKEIRPAPFEPGQWFVLGRNIYQSACGNAHQALEFLKNLDIELSRFPQETAIFAIGQRLRILGRLCGRSPVIDISKAATHCSATWLLTTGGFHSNLGTKPFCL